MASLVNRQHLLPTRSVRQQSWSQSLLLCRTGLLLP